MSFDLLSGLILAGVAMSKQGLGSTARGPIADTYYDLQRLEQIEGALATGDQLPNPNHQFAHAYLQSLELIFLNLSNIAEKASRALSNGPQRPLVGCWRWHEAISHLGVKIFYRLLAITDDAGLAGELTLVGAGSRAARTYLKDKAEVDLLLRERYWAPRGGEMDADHRFASNADESALLLQISKNTNHDIVRLLTTPILGGDPKTYDQRIGGRHLRRAVSLDDYQMEDTFFLQFLLLHQVPEIIGDRIVEAFDQAVKRLEKDDLLGALETLPAAVTALDLVIESLTPLRALMIPADYFKIRENLGLTSGSHSDTLHTQLLNRAFGKLRVAADRYSAGRDSSGATVLRRLMRRLSVQLLQWRSEHLVFPRNLLGGHGTRSLVGAPDGLEAAERMLASYAGSVSMALPRRRATGRTAALLAQIVSEDDRLLAVTAQVTQKGFQKVQERLPPFDGRPKKGQGRRSTKERGKDAG